MRPAVAPAFLLAALALGAAARPSAAQNPTPPAPAAGALAAGGLPQLGRVPLRDVVAALTDSEKVRLVVGTGIILPAEMGAGAAAAFPPAMRGPTPTADDAPPPVPGAAGTTHAVRRLGIPSITVSDGPAGVRIDPIRRGADGKPDSSRTYYATAFPVGTLLASSWDTALVRRVGVAFGEEVRDYGVDVLLGPGMNIHRNPLGGRNFEYYSEDPLVTGAMAAAIVNGIQSSGVGTSVKHFAANEQEFNRMRLNEAIGERALREIYLRGFEIAVKRAQPWTVMSSYNLVNGTHTAESRALLTDLLRGEFGFRGLVMSDWFGGENPVAMLAAGNDLLMPGTNGQAQAVMAALASGKLTRAQLDTNVTRVLELVLKSPTFRGVPHTDRPDLRAHAAVSRQAAAESMVLLRNAAPRGAAGGGRPALPLAAGGAVAVFGNTSYDPIAGGTGSGDVNRAYTVSLAEGLDSAGLRVDSALGGAYRRYVAAERAKAPPRNLMADLFAPRPIIAELAPDAAALRQAAERDAAAVVTLGRIAGEGLDRAVGDFELRAPERALLQQVSAAFRARGKPVVVVLNVGGPVEVASWRDQADAILLAWQPGQEAGHAIADVLTGRVNPSGKLATTFPVRYADVPYAADFPGRVRPDAAPAANPLMGRASENTYAEGVYVGYRYTRTFGKAPAYAFGHGLSYTTFRYGGLRLAGLPNTVRDSVTATVTVTNTGRVAGREVAELYVSAPKGALDKPERELKGFAKTALLRPGASETLTFRLGAADLASFDPAASAWVADAGTYTVRVGGSSDADGARATFALPQRLVVEQSRKLLAPRAPVAELRATR